MFYFLKKERKTNKQKKTRNKIPKTNMATKDKAEWWV